MIVQEQQPHGLDGKRLLLDETLTDERSNLNEKGRQLKRRLLDATLNVQDKPEFTMRGRELFIARMRGADLDTFLKTLAGPWTPPVVEGKFNQTTGVITIRSSLPFLEEDLRLFEGGDVLGAQYWQPPLLYVIEVFIRIGANYLDTIDTIAGWMKQGCEV